MPHNIRRIKDGEPLTSAVANRPIDDIVQWMSQLTSRLDSYTDSACNILRDQPLDVDVHVGAPVYLNRLTGTFSRARVSSRVEGDQVV